VLWSLPLAGPPAEWRATAPASLVSFLDACLRLSSHALYGAYAAPVEPPAQQQQQKQQQQKHQQLPKGFSPKKMHEVTALAGLVEAACAAAGPGAVIVLDLHYPTCH
jgi:hypothetical protein